MDPRPPLLVGRYAIYDRIAVGGMATVHLGRLVGEGGFARTVAIKRLHAHLALDPDFVSMFLDEARLAARIRHPNVVHTLDVVVADTEVFLVMEYVEGESLACLIRILSARGEAMAPSHASGLISPVLHGLHAAHEAKTDQGEPLAMVHRDVSPQNILVGIDGVPRVLDFGVAKALGQSHSTRDGEIKGKLAYMSPEQVEGRAINRRTDVFAASVVLWEALTGKRLFKGKNDAHVLRMLLTGDVQPPSSIAPAVPRSLDAVVMRGLARDAAARFATAEEMADALEDAAPPLATRKLATWLQAQLGDRLAARATLLKEIESSSGVGPARNLPVAATADVALDLIPEPIHDEEAPTRIASQVSSISVVAAPRPSASPPRSRLSPMALVAGAAAVCLGIARLAAAARGPRDAPAATATSSPTAPSPSMAPPSVSSLPPTVVVAPGPTIPVPTAAEAPATAMAPAPRLTASARPAATPPRPTSKTPAPASTLFSRF